MHKHHVACFDCRVTAYTAHCNSYIRAHKHGRVVDAVSDKAQNVAFLLLGKQLFNVFHLVLRKKRRFVIGKSDFLRNACRDNFVITGEHNGFCAHSVEFGYSLLGFGFDLVRDEQRADKTAVFCHVHDSADAVLLDVFDIVGLHQLLIAAIDNVIAFRCDNTEARNVRECVSALDFASIATYDRTCNRVVRIVLGNGGKTQNFVFVAFGFDCRDDKVAFCERTRLVEHEHVGFVEHFKIVRAFDEYALSRRRADAREERERH